MNHEQFMLSSTVDGTLVPNVSVENEKLEDQSEKNNQALTERSPSAPSKISTVALVPSLNPSLTPVWGSAVAETSFSKGG